MMWKGAQFRVASFEDSMRFLEKVINKRDPTAQHKATPEDFQYLGYLFEVTHDSKPLIRILASTFQAGKLDE